MAGTNNLQDDCHSILGAYNVMIDKACKVDNRRITVVGILKRFGVSEFVESKRSVLNMRLREICQRKGVEFINIEMRRNMLGRDGVHLNLKGRQVVCQKIMKHSLYFLE